MAISATPHRIITLEQDVQYGSRRLRNVPTKRNFPAASLVTREDGRHFFVYKTPTSRGVGALPFAAYFAQNQELQIRGTWLEIHAAKTENEQSIKSTLRYKLLCAPRVSQPYNSHVRPHRESPAPQSLQHTTEIQAPTLKQVPRSTLAHNPCHKHRKHKFDQPHLLHPTPVGKAGPLRRFPSCELVREDQPLGSLCVRIHKRTPRLSGPCLS